MFFSYAHTFKMCIRYFGRAILSMAFILMYKRFA